MGIPYRSTWLQQQLAGLRPVTAYELTAWARVGEVAEGRQARLEVRGQDATPLASARVSSASYAQVSLRFRTRPGEQAVTTAVEYLGGTGTAYLDGFHFEELPPG